MMSLASKAIGGSIHRIREFELEKVNLAEEFDVLQIVGEGWFGKIFLTEHCSTQTEMVLKALPKAYISVSDFFREFHYGLHLSAHRNIVTTYDIAFETSGFYVFSQEYAPLGDLTSNITEIGLGELHSKRVSRQLAAAVHHIHSRELVHRDIKLDNILVFRSDFSRIKLCDFGETRKFNSTVRRHNEWLPYSPPEILQIETDDTYKALPIHDVWHFGIVLFVCLTGCVPWQKAAVDDPRYIRYLNWHSATLNIAKKPKLFNLISSHAQRIFKRLLDPRPEKRCKSVLEINKYIGNRWLAKLGVEKALNGDSERDELCPSMYSFHSSLEEKNRLLYSLTMYGIETTVDRKKKKDRIREWIQSSAIVEEEELDEQNDSDLDVFENGDEAGMPEIGSRKLSVEGGSDKKLEKQGTTSNLGRKTVTQDKLPQRKIPFVPQVAEERNRVAKLENLFNENDNSLKKENEKNPAIENTKKMYDDKPKEKDLNDVKNISNDIHGKFDAMKRSTSEKLHSSSRKFSLNTAPSSETTFYNRESFPARRTQSDSVLPSGSSPVLFVAQKSTENADKFAAMNRLPSKNSIKNVQKTDSFEKKEKATSSSKSKKSSTKELLNHLSLGHGKDLYEQYSLKNKTNHEKNADNETNASFEKVEKVEISHN